MTSQNKRVVLAFCLLLRAGESSQPLLASCAGDAEVRLHDLASGAHSTFSHHGSRVKKLVTEPGNPHLLISCSEDGTGEGC
jgi:WD40 repeat protein